mmetsp:Transcript_89089/g.255087  ORF Transcript_89089/g.255087 Transcript_89089/m.255087 type:complete len:324 (+) Transcript_89089:72-1043(+)
MASCGQVTSRRLNRADKWAYKCDRESDCESTEEETTTPTTVSEADSCDIVVEDDIPEVLEEHDEEPAPQLGAGLYHDDIEVTPPQIAQAPSVHTSSAERAETASASSSSSAAGDEKVSFTKEETLFVFDYDDTILPSSWINAQHLRLDDRSTVRPWQMEFLSKAAVCAIETLRLAKQHGTVVLVTNAERGWIELSCRKFMPMLAPLLETVRMVSARTAYEGPSAPLPLDWKVCAFEAELDRFYGSDLHDAAKVKNIFSLGDGAHEREALLRTAAEVPNARAKSLKFCERPDISQIIKQHHLVQGCFETMWQHDGDLDLCTRCD